MFDIRFVEEEHGPPRRREEEKLNEERSKWSNQNMKKPMTIHNKYTNNTGVTENYNMKEINNRKIQELQKIIIWKK